MWHRYGPRRAVQLPELVTLPCFSQGSLPDTLYFSTEDSSRHRLPGPPPAPWVVGRGHHPTQQARLAQWRPSACGLCPGNIGQEEAARRPEWGQRRPCPQGESHPLSCEGPCASSLGFGFLVRSPSTLADLKLRGEKETEAGRDTWKEMQKLKPNVEQKARGPPISAG